MIIQIALLRYFPYKLSSLVAKKIKSKALAADGTLQCTLNSKPKCTKKSGGAGLTITLTSFVPRYGQLYVNSEVLIENARTYLWGKNPQTCAKVRTFWWVFLPHLLDTEGAKNPPKCANLAQFDLSGAAGFTGLLICERR